MKKSFSVFIGIDVSKFKLDVCCLQTTEKQGWHHVFDNTVKGIRLMLKWVNESLEGCKEDYLFCLEHTGIYTMPLCCCLSEQQ